jgi:preprotein translocase subunit Sec63
MIVCFVYFCLFSKLCVLISMLMYSFVSYGILTVMFVPFWANKQYTEQHNKTEYTEWSYTSLHFTTLVDTSLPLI